MSTRPIGSTNGAWLLSTVRDEDWRQSAACRDADAFLFDERLLGESVQQQTARHAEALAICAGCSVVDACRKSAIRGVDEGIRGNRRLPPIKPRTHVKTPVEIVHGKEKGATQHRRRGEKPCASCAAAAARAHVDRDRKAAEREAAKEAARNAPRLPCGTYDAYNQHRGRGEDIDDACREARNAHDRALVAQRRAARERAAS